MNTSRTITAAALLGVAALTACKPVEGAAPAVPPGSDGDVVVAVGMSRSHSVETHYVVCAAAPGEPGAYEVLVAEQVADGIRQGTACPQGPRRPMPQERYPELSAEISQAFSEPLPYRGGNLHTCGKWATASRAEARRLAAECPPLKAGDLR